MRFSRRSSRGADVRRRLLDAAWAEFGEHGYLGTHTNRIAVRAQASPRTFYRHFDNKLAVFRVVYAEWISLSWEATQTEGDVDVVSRAIADAVCAHYAQWPKIRASVRMLSTSEPSFRDLYLAEGRRQMEITRANRAARGQPPLSAEEHLVGLVVVERLADALIFGEVEALGADEEPFLDLFARFIATYVTRDALFVSPR